MSLLAKATGLSNREAFRKALEVASGDGVQTCSEQKQQKYHSPGTPTLPADAHNGSHTELATVASLRGLSLAGVKLASERGLLIFGRVCGVSCWIITDSTRSLAQARRMDGLPFPAFGKLAARKAHTVKGSSQGWPIGAKEAAAFAGVLLVEGGPDLLAACHCIAEAKRERELAPVAVLGAANLLRADALALLAGKLIRIYPHADDAGAAAGARWLRQLAEAGVEKVDAFHFDSLSMPDGTRVKDLNDAARLTSAAFQPEGLLP